MFVQLELFHFNSFHNNNNSFNSISTVQLISIQIPILLILTIRFASVQNVDENNFFTPRMLCFVRRSAAVIMPQKMLETYLNLALYSIFSAKFVVYTVVFIHV